ncbi:hypothetical protein WH95_19585 [Kiloniella litopenaei]|uniref:Uncharacterized protein n=1 Tax=Kiloniella litopenaei TaxID=1549748 RepID=A0A0M2R6S7_9PROT|nr:hypothetical protein [Kiloniella litopenaei]KKJ75223.1 hypothetical protein WH95_19585 [Kiloniella litopenaei]
MKRKYSRILKVALLTTTLYGSGVHAQGIPVIDNSNLVKAIEDAIIQNKDLVEQVKQYAELVKTYNQLVQNARAHGDIAKLINLYGIGSDLINGPAAKSIFSELYGLDPNSPLYEQQARDILEKKFELPKSSQVSKVELGKYLSAEDTQAVVDRWAATNRDSAEAIKNTGVLANEELITVRLNDNRQKIHDAMPTGPDNLNASVQHGLIQTEHEMLQRDQQIRLDKLQTEMKLREEIRRLQEEKKRQERFKNRLKRDADMRAQTFTDQKLPSSAQ